MDLELAFPQRLLSAEQHALRADGRGSNCRLERDTNRQELALDVSGWGTLGNPVATMGLTSIPEVLGRKVRFRKRWAHL
jgi:hypothetical protein